MSEEGEFKVDSSDLHPSGMDTYPKRALLSRPLDDSTDHHRRHHDRSHSLIGDFDVLKSKFSEEAEFRDLSPRDSTKRRGFKRLGSVVISRIRTQNTAEMRGKDTIFTAFFANLLKERDYVLFDDRFVEEKTSFIVKHPDITSFAAIVCYCSETGSHDVPNWFKLEGFRWHLRFEKAKILFMCLTPSNLKLFGFTAPHESSFVIIPRKSGDSVRNTDNQGKTLNCFYAKLKKSDEIVSPVVFDHGSLNKSLIQSEFRDIVTDYLFSPYTDGLMWDYVYSVRDIAASDLRLGDATGSSGSDGMNPTGRYDSVECTIETVITESVMEVSLDNMTFSSNIMSNSVDIVFYCASDPEALQAALTQHLHRKPFLSSLPPADAQGMQALFRIIPVFRRAFAGRSESHPFRIFLLRSLAMLSHLIALDTPSVVVGSIFIISGGFVNTTLQPMLYPMKGYDKSTLYHSITSENLETIVIYGSDDYPTVLDNASLLFDDPKLLYIDDPLELNELVKSNRIAEVDMDRILSSSPCLFMKEVVVTNTTSSGEVCVVNNTLIPLALITLTDGSFKQISETVNSLCIKTGIDESQASFISSHNASGEGDELLFIRSLIYRVIRSDAQCAQGCMNVNAFPAALINGIRSARVPLASEWFLAQGQHEQCMIKDSLIKLIICRHGMLVSNKVVDMIHKQFPSPPMCVFDMSSEPSSAVQQHISSLCDGCDISNLFNWEEFLDTDERDYYDVEDQDGNAHSCVQVPIIVIGIGNRIRNILQLNSDILSFCVNPLVSPRCLPTEFDCDLPLFRGFAHDRSITLQDIENSESRASVLKKCRRWRRKIVYVSHEEEEPEWLGDLVATQHAKFCKSSILVFHVSMPNLSFLCSTSAIDRDLQANSHLSPFIVVCDGANAFSCLPLFSNSIGLLTFDALQAIAKTMVHFANQITYNPRYYPLGKGAIERLEKRSAILLESHPRTSSFDSTESDVQ